MSLQVLPLKAVKPAQIRPLIVEESKGWLGSLSWDRRSISDLIYQQIIRGRLDGFVALAEGNAAAYSFFVIESDGTANIGTIYVSPRAIPEHLEQASRSIVESTISSLKRSPKVERIQAQVFDFSILGQSVQAFSSNGFKSFTRSYLTKDLDDGSHAPSDRPASGRSSEFSLRSWDERYLDGASEVIFSGYEGSDEPKFCKHLRSLAGCSSFVQGISSGFWCGAFLPQASYVALDGRGQICGVILSSAISDRTGFIAQVSVRPSHQGCGLGRQLMSAALDALTREGYREASLIVTASNLKALSWYWRLGFKPRRKVYAFAWERL